MVKKRSALIKHAFCLLAAAGVLLHGVTAFAAPATVERGIPATQGSISGTTAKVVFNWPTPGNFSAYLDGNKINITFDRTVNPDFGPLLSALYPYINSAKRNADGKSIVLSMDETYRIRTFKTGNSNGVELLNIDPEKKRNRGKSTPAKEPAKEPELAKEAEKPKVAEAVKPAAAPAAAALSPAGAKPADPAPAEVKAIEEAHDAAKKEPPATPAVPASEESAKPAAIPVKVVEPEAAKPVPVAETKPDVKEESKPAEPAAPKPEPKAEEVKAPETKPETKPEVKPETAAATPAPEVKPEPKALEEVKPQVPLVQKMKVSVSTAEDSATLRFPFNERTASAVFIRSGTLWVVFNKQVSLDLSDFNDLPQTVIGKANLLTQNGVTVLQIPVTSTVLPTIAKEAGKYEWAVLLTPKNRLLSNALNVEIKTDPPAPPNVFIPVLEMASTIEFNDPVVGDTLVITPLYNLGEGLLRTRDFIEFSLLETAQGIVVSKKADDVKVIQLRNGLRVSPNQGITLTPGLPPVTDQTRDAASLQTSSTLFPYENWKLPADKDRNKFIAELLQEVVFAKDPEAANRSRLRLAQLYLSEGMAPEALAHLESIGRTGIVFYRSAKLSALHGAANFLMARYAEAARDFSATELNNNKEVEYWRSVLSDLLGSPEPYDYLALNEDYISRYPPLFRQKLAVVAADRVVENKDYNTALKIFDTMKEGDLLVPIQDYVNYLLAVISAATGQEEEAIAMWDKLADNHKAPFVQARAEFSRILWGMERGTINKEQAIERLERLRLAWHGDNMELKVLSMLGNLYAERKDYPNSMRVWDGAVSSFPNTSQAVEMERKLEDAFVSMFDEGAAGHMSPLDVLTLYYQYRTHAPGGNVGNQLVALLADKLVAVDLLKEAAALLDKQMRETEKEQRSEIGAKLAAIHLLNNDPKRALVALQDSVFGDIAQPLSLWRNRLLAQSLADLGQPSRALDIIKSDLSVDAEQIRLGVYWQARDWRNIINSGEAILKVRKNVGKLLTLDESDAVLKLALAYVFEDNKVQLQYLRDYFEPLMTNNPYKPLFDFVTAKDVALTPANFEELIGSVSNTRSFLEGYRARIQTAGLNTVTGNNPAAPATPQP